VGCVFISGSGEGVVFLGFTPPNTMVKTIVYILVILYNEHTSTILNFLLFPPSFVSHTSGRFCKACIIFFNNFVLQISITAVSDDLWSPVWLLAKVLSGNWQCFVVVISTGTNVSGSKLQRSDLLEP
jgi:hypothetical protein